MVGGGGEAVNGCLLDGKHAFFPRAGDAGVKKWGGKKYLKVTGSFIQPILESFEFGQGEMGGLREIGKGVYPSESEKM